MTDNRLSKLPVIPERVANALKGIEEAAGGRMKLITELSAANLTPDLEYVVGLIADPRNDTKTLARICSMADITVGKFLSLMGEVKMSRAILDAQDRVARLLPEVAEDLMKRSVPYTVECSGCMGTGNVMVIKRGQNVGGGGTPEEPDEVPCPECRGRGELSRQPDFERQKIALEMAGMIKRGGGVQVGVQVNTPGLIPPLTTSSKFRGATDRLMFGRRAPESQTVDAEVVEESKE